VHNFCGDADLNQPDRLPFEDEDETGARSA